jgi:hypothetical protein
MNFVPYHIEFHIFATYMIIKPCFTLIYGDFPMISFIWFITLQNIHSLFCVFFTFRDLYGVTLTWDFWCVVISSGEAPWNLEAHLDGTEAQKRLGGTPRHVGRTT